MTQQALHKTDIRADEGIMENTLIPYLDENGECSVKPIKKIEVGDKVFNRFGKPQKVTLTTESTSKQKALKVILEDYREVSVAKNHLWDIVTSSGYKTVTTSDMMKMIKNGEDIYIPRNHSVKTLLDSDLSKRKKELSDEYQINSKHTNMDILFKSKESISELIAKARELGYRVLPMQNQSGRYVASVTSFNKNRVKVLEVKEELYTYNTINLYVDDPEHLFMVADYIVTHDATNK